MGMIGELDMPDERTLIRHIQFALKPHLPRRRPGEILEEEETYGSKPLVFCYLTIEEFPQFQV